MSPSPNPSAPRGGPLRQTPGERMWYQVFYTLSALMAALALVDFTAGRFAQGLGDVGVACLMLSLMGQFPFLRAMVAAGSSGAPEKAREELLREAQRLRLANPWAARLSHAGWLLLLASLALRLVGAA